MLAVRGPLELVARAGNGQSKHLRWIIMTSLWPLAVMMALPFVLLQAMMLLAWLLR